jgi:TRAP-type C4-dicarboxylate transport system permease small subunit
MGFFEKYIIRLGQWGTVLGAVFLLMVALIVVATVIGRALHIAFPGTFDLIETLIVVAIAFAIVYGQIEDRHLRAEIAMQHIKGRLKSLIESFTEILDLVYFAVLLWAALAVMLEKIEGGERTSILEVPIVPFRGVWVLALILMVFLLGLKWIRNIKGLIKGGEEGK